MAAYDDRDRGRPRRDDDRNRSGGTGRPDRAPRDRDGAGSGGSRGGYQGRRDDDRGGYQGNRSGGDRPGYQGNRSGGDRDRGGYQGNRSDSDRGGYQGNRSGGDRPGYQGNRDSDRGGYQGNRSGGDRDRGGYQGNRDSDRGGYQGNRSGGDRDRGGYQGNRSADSRGGYQGNRDSDRGGYQGNRSGGDRDRGGYQGNRSADSRGGYQGNRDSDRGGYQGNRSGGDRDRGGYQGSRSGGDRPGYQGNRDSDRGGYQGNRSGGDRDRGGYQGNRSGGDRDRGGYQGNRSGGDRPGYQGNRDSDRGGYQGNRQDDDRGGYQGRRDDDRGGHQGRRDDDRRERPRRDDDRQERTHEGRPTTVWHNGRRYVGGTTTARNKATTPRPSGERDEHGAAVEGTPERPIIPDWDADGAAPAEGGEPSLQAEGERLQKVIAAAGVASRRVAENLIAEGRVTVNGEVVEFLGRRVDPEADLVAVDGVPVQTDTSRRYVVLNKPTGIVSSMLDERGRPDLSQFVDRYEERLFNVGRLDAETAGLIVLTNDGALAHVLAHPSFGVTKTYVAKVSGSVLPATMQRLLEGVELEDGSIRADKARMLESVKGSSLVEITLHSGRNRVVRRMFDEVGHPVEELVRRSFGPLQLGGLAPGQTRELTTVELGKLLAIARGAAGADDGAASSSSRVAPSSGPSSDDDESGD